MRNLIVTKSSIFEWESPSGSVFITAAVILGLGYLSHLLWKEIREYQVSWAKGKHERLHSLTEARGTLHMVLGMVASLPHSFRTVGPLALTG